MPDTDSQPTAPTPDGTRRVHTRGPDERSWVLGVYHPLAAPVSWVFALLVLAASIVAGTGPTAGWFASAEATLSQTQWWTPFSALLVSGSVVGCVASLLLCLVGLPLAERALGHARLAGSLGLGGAVAVTLGVFAEAGLARWPGLSGLAGDGIASPTIALVVAGVAATGASGALWRRRVRVVVLAVVVLFALYSSDPASWVRLASISLGMALSWRWFGAAEPLLHWSGSVDERRRLISGFTALVGLGPLAGLLSGGGRGPLAEAASVFSATDPALAELCAQHHRPVCDHLEAATLSHGLGATLLAVVPLALLVVAAIGLRAGRRAAWFLGIGTSGLLAIAAITAALTDSVEVDGEGGRRVIDLALWGLDSIGLPLVIVVVLIIARRSFAVRAERRAARRFALTVGGSLLVLALAYLVAERTWRAEWGADPSWLHSLLALAHRFLPQSLLYDVAPFPFPHHGPALFAWHWVGVLFWIIAIVALLRLYAQPRSGEDARRADLLEVMRAGDAGTLQWLGTWDGVRHWFAPDGRGAVAYRLVSGVALTVSDPWCTRENRPEVLRGFISFATESGYIPVFYSIHEDVALELRALGWSDMTVAEESVLHPATWSMAGKAGEKVRQPYNRALREGLRTEWTSWSELPPRQSLRLREISEEWVADRTLPEMGFTLGSIPEMQPGPVRLMLVLDEDDTVLAVTSWLPSYTHGILTGWTLDVMRRAPEAPNGVMEFVIASTLLQAKDDGVEVLSLSGAPLATEGADAAMAGAGAGAGADAAVAGADRAADGGRAPASLVPGLLDQLSAALEPVYGFHSLFRFKKKFRPEHQPLLMSYADPLQLATIGLAVGRAYLPFASSREVVALGRVISEGRNRDKDKKDRR